MTSTREPGAPDAGRPAAERSTGAASAEVVIATLAAGAAWSLDELARTAVGFLDDRRDAAGEVRRRGLIGQIFERRREQRARALAGRIARRMRGFGVSRAALAKALDASTRTLRRWAALAEKDRLPAPAALGRPPKRGTRLERDQVIAQLRTAGRFVSVAELCAIAPGMSRREAAELRWRYRRSLPWHRRTFASHALRWSRPGAVWAADYTKTPLRVDGIERDVLAVRDLASGFQLLALPAEHGDAATTRKALAFLFAEHGAPLVIKSDNGSHFTAAEVRALLDAHEVLHLRSPAGTPTYNGACESGIGWLKARATQLAVGDDRDGLSAGDLVCAMDLGNEGLRRVGGTEQTPAQVWAARQPITREERAALRRAFAPHESAARVALGLPAEGQLEDDVRAAVERAAIGDALHDLGLLTTRRRSIRLPSKR